MVAVYRCSFTPTSWWSSWATKPLLPLCLKANSKFSLPLTITNNQSRPIWWNMDFIEMCTNYMLWRCSYNISNLPLQELVPDMVYAWKAYILLQHFKVCSVNCTCIWSGSRSSITVFEAFEVKGVNELAVTSNKLTNTFEGLVAWRVSQTASRVTLHYTIESGRTFTWKYIQIL